MSKSRIPEIISDVGYSSIHGVQGLGFKVGGPRKRCCAKTRPHRRPLSRTWEAATAGHKRLEGSGAFVSKVAIGLLGTRLGIRAGVLGDLVNGLIM